MSDIIDQIFSLESNEDDYYPGSRRKRTERAAPPEEFHPDEWRDTYTTKTINGEEIRFYTIGALSNALGVSVPTIRQWIKNGRIPQAPYRLPANMLVKGSNVEGRRLYTEEIIDVTVEIFRKHGILGRRRILWDNHPEVPIEIMQEWSRLASKTNK